MVYVSRGAPSVARETNHYSAIGRLSKKLHVLENLLHLKNRSSHGLALIYDINLLSSGSRERANLSCPGATIQ